LRSGAAVDLLFTDVVMPGQLRSPELARQAKLLIPGIEVLFTSGYTQNAIVHGGRLDPGVHLLSKPYRREHLAGKIRHLLETRLQAALSRNAVPAPANVNATSSSCRILVVEDNLDLQLLACEMLAMLGYEARGAASAEEAIELLAGDRFDVLFTDFSLPGMNGVELAKKAQRDRPELKIIFASGYGDIIEDTAEFQSIVLPKPYDMAKLEQALKQADELSAAK
jgi:CheY-like chemotaxis protein